MDLRNKLEEKIQIYNSEENAFFFLYEFFIHVLRYLYFYKKLNLSFRMIANSMNWESLIYVSQEEVESLRHSSIRGVINRRSIKGLSDRIPLELGVGEINKKNIFAEFFTIPERVYFEEAEEFCIILSDTGYHKLREIGYAGDRMFDNPDCRVEIFLRDSL